MGLGITIEGGDTGWVLERGALVSGKMLILTSCPHFCPAVGQSYDETAASSSS